MGIFMPKFVTDSCTSVKESYYSFKNGVKEIKENFELAKTAFRMARSLNTSKFAETRDPKDIVDAIHNSGDAIPESYKSLMNMIPEETMARLTNILFETFHKNNKFGQNNPESSPERTSPSPSVTEETATFEYTKAQSIKTHKEAQNYPSGEDVSKAIERMTDDRPEIVSPTESDTRRPVSQTDYIDVDPPSNINFNPEYTEMKSDDEKETRFDNNLKNQENTEEEPKHNPFGLGNDFNYHRPSESAHEPFIDPADSPSFGSKENNYNRSQNGDSFADKSPQNNSSRTYEEKTKDLPPMTKRLGEELTRRFGTNWRQRVPGFLHNPELQDNIPDLGLGLSKENNQDMIMSMSRVIKDLM